LIATGWKTKGKEGVKVRRREKEDVSQEDWGVWIRRVASWIREQRAKGIAIRGGMGKKWEFGRFTEKSWNSDIDW